MNQYYVQSGTFRSVVAADSPAKAALWGVHQVMQQVLPVDEETAEGRSPKPLAVLSQRVRVAQHGFDRSDATEMPTLDVVTQWNEMVTTLDRLERLLGGATG